jgi:DNA-binding NtrC family response regulator
VRELRNVMTRARVIARGGEIDVEHIVFDGTTEAAANAAVEAPIDDERTRIAAALDSCAGNQTRAAKMLGISRSTLIQKIRLLDIPRPRPKP